jgi:hypothetical protein
VGLIPQEDILVEVGSTIDNLRVIAWEVIRVSTECSFALHEEAMCFKACARKLLWGVDFEWAHEAGLQ